MKPEPIGVCIPHSVDLTRFEPPSFDERMQFRDQKGISKSDFVYGYIAQPVRSRWTPPLFESFARVLRKRPDSHLYVAGLGENFPELHQSLPHEVRSKITIDGFLHGDEKLRQAYGAMDTFVHNSHLGETFGLVLTESMCCDTPVITVAKPLRGNAQCEVVRNGTGGMVIADESHLVDAMTRMQDETEEHGRMRTEGRSSVERRYSKTIVQGMILGLAEHVRAAHDRDELRIKLESDPLFRTHIDRSELLRESGGLFGSSGLKGACMQRVIMTPLFQRLLTAFRRRRLR